MVDMYSSIAWIRNRINKFCQLFGNVLFLRKRFSKSTPSSHSFLDRTASSAWMRFFFFRFMYTRTGLFKRLVDYLSASSGRRVPASKDCSNNQNNKVFLSLFFFSFSVSVCLIKTLYMQILYLFVVSMETSMPCQKWFPAFIRLGALHNLLCTYAYRR